MVSVNNSEVNEWREAVIDACVIDCINWYEDDPRKTIHQLCAYEQDIALDPLVSRDAQNLIDGGIEKCIQEVETWISSWPTGKEENTIALKKFVINKLKELKGKHHGIGSKRSTN